MLLANAINILNDKGVKYRVEQKKGASISFAFGLHVKEKPEKIEVIPEETAIQVKVLGTEKKLDEAGFGLFLDTIIEIKALQEKEVQLIEALKV